MLPVDSVPQSLEQYLGSAGSVPESNKNNASQIIFPVIIP